MYKSESPVDLIAQELRLQGTDLRSLSPAHPLPEFIVVEPGVTIAEDAAHCNCPALVTTHGARVALSPSYYDFSLCSCELWFFGHANSCVSCIDQCNYCRADLLIGCFPSGDALIPCGTTSTGVTLCNPNNISWPLFTSPNDNLKEWCFEGHEGRLCSRCSDGFFSVARDCSLCGGLVWKLSLIAVFVVAVIVLLAVLYFQTSEERVASSGTLDILLFHSQQLGLLLSTDAWFSKSATSFFIIISSASSASLQTGMAFECFGLTGVREQVLLALVVLLILLSLLTTGYFLRTFCGFGQQLIRSMSVLLAVINIILLPAAQIAFSSLGCTDARTSSSRFLNQASWQPCDTTWQQSILPAGLAASVLCLLIAASATWAAAEIRRLHMQQHLPKRVSRVLRPLVGSFRPEHAWWFSVIMWRRLLLAVAMSFVPYYSAFLPLSLFFIVQTSALVQHIARPFAKRFDNRAELASLYFLLVNYFSSILRTAVSYDSAAATSMDGWFDTLLGANISFVILLAVRVVVGLLPADCLSRLRVCDKLYRCFFVDNDQQDPSEDNESSLLESDDRSVHLLSRDVSSLTSINQ